MQAGTQRCFGVQLINYVVCHLVELASHGNNRSRIQGALPTGSQALPLSQVGILQLNEEQKYHINELVITSAFELCAVPNGQSVPSSKDKKSHYKELRNIETFCRRSNIYDRPSVSSNPQDHVRQGEVACRIRVRVMGIRMYTSSSADFMAMGMQTRKTPNMAMAVLRRQWTGRQ